MQDQERSLVFRCTLACGLLQGPSRICSSCRCSKKRGFQAQNRKSQSSRPASLCRPCCRFRCLREDAGDGNRRHLRVVAEVDARQDREEYRSGGAPRGRLVGPAPVLPVLAFPICGGSGRSGGIAVPTPSPGMGTVLIQAAYRVCQYCDEGPAPLTAEGHADR